MAGKRSDERRNSIGHTSTLQIPSLTGPRPREETRSEHARQGAVSDVAADSLMNSPG